MRCTKMTIGGGHTKGIRKIFTLPLFIGLLFLSNAFALNAQALSVIPSENENLYGMTTPAGSGRHLPTPSTNICKVTNLRDSGAGSLRYCIEDAPAPKIIIFEVSGNIELQSNIRFEEDDSYTTVAGQTAPSPGITLKHYGLRINGSVHDILIQHIRIRPGDTGIIENFCPDCSKGREGNPLVIGGTDYFDNNIVVDHTSLSWGGDMTFTNSGSRLTAINNLLAEPLASPLHSKGLHSKGFYNLAYADPYTQAQNVAFVKNMITHSSDRSPAFSAGSGIMANNYIYDSGGTLRGEDVDTIDKGPIQLSIVGNRVDHSTRNPNGRVINFRSRNEGDGTKYYISEDNMSDDNLITDPWNESPYVHECFNWGSCTDMPASKIATTREEANWPVGYETMPVAQVKSHILANVGARPADRDPVDIRLINKPSTGQGHIIQTQDDVGGWPELDENVWTLTPPANPDEVQSSGYTNLEEWLHQFSDYVEGTSGTFPVGVGAPTLSTTPTPSVRILASTASIARGFSVTLTWESVNTNSCSSSDFDTSGATNGTKVISPNEDTDFTITCSGPGGDATDNIFVRVVPLPDQGELVAHFDMEEGSGTTISDSSTYNHTGTLQGGTTWTSSGHTGNALEFNDTDAIVETDFAMGDLSTFTATLWMYPRSLDEREGVFSSSALTVHYNLEQWEFKLSAQDNIELCKIRKGGSLPVLDTWNFIAIGYDGENCFIHFRDNYEYGGDGGLDWQQMADSTLKIGKGNGSYSDSWFDGYIDDVRIYNYALSESELETLKTGNPLPPPQPVTILESLAPSIAYGTSTTINWTSSSADTCTGTNFDTQGATSGSVIVTPEETTTYTLICTSSEGSSERNLSVNVYEPIYEEGEVAALYTFEESGGTTLFDSSGQGNHATVNGATWTSEGHTGGALDFDGVDDVVNTPVNLSNSPSFTVTGWMKPRLFDGREGFIMGPGLYIHKNGKWQIRVISSSVNDICKLNLDDLPQINEWNFLAVSYDGGDCHLHYLDTYQTITALDDQMLRSGNLKIGRGNGSYSDSWFDGLIDDVRIYSYALTQQEIEAVRDNQDFLGELGDINPIDSVTRDRTPEYTFHTNRYGTLSYGGSCTSDITNSELGNNTITFHSLDSGVYNDCTMTLTDLKGRQGPSHTLPEFIITKQSDFNTDRIVNIFDYSTLLTNFGATADCGNEADANEDCSVNIFDYNVLLGEFGMSV